MVTGTKNADILDIKFGDTLSALGGADTINVTQADSAFDTTTTPYGLIDGGAGIDTLILNAPGSDDWIYTFSRLLSVEKLGFTTIDGFFDRAEFFVTVPKSATGTVAAAAPLAIAGSAGGNELAFVVTGGMGSASAITLPGLTFTGFDPVTRLAISPGDDYVELRAGDASNYVLKASDAIGRQGIEQDIVGNAGNDTLIGSVGADWLIGNGGADKMYGRSGDDMFTVIGSAQPVAGDLYNGGAGVDFLSVNGRFGPVTFAGKLVSIEGIRVARDAFLNITANQMAMLPDALKISGRDTGTLNITGAKTFSAAKFTFLGEESPTISISGTAGADVITGSSGDDILDGGGGADRLTGRAGSDALYGGAGADILTGGRGADAFVFDTIPAAAARDTILDFKSAEGDKIGLFLNLFPGIQQSGGALETDTFFAASGAKAANDAEDRIIYNTASGVLYYDADGVSGQAAVAFAVLKGQPALTAADIVLI